MLATSKICNIGRTKHQLNITSVVAPTLQTPASISPILCPVANTTQFIRITNPYRCCCVPPRLQSDKAPSSTEDFSDSSTNKPEQLPTFQEGVNWLCYSIILLIFLTDFTPIGPLLRSAPDALIGLAALQWGLFVGPNVLLSVQKKWDLKIVYRLEACSATSATAGLALGVGTWLATAAAVSLKTGNPVLPMEVVDSGLSAVMARVKLDAGQVAYILGTTALSPAVAEEILFRGFFLTAMQQRFGRVDAVALSAAAFALVHLEPARFFNFCVLGFVTGGAAVASGSLLPAVLVHLAYNCTGVAAALLAQQ